MNVATDTQTTRLAGRRLVEALKQGDKNELDFSFVAPHRVVGGSEGSCRDLPRGRSLVDGQVKSLFRWQGSPLSARLSGCFNFRRPLPFITSLVVTRLFFFFFFKSTSNLKGKNKKYYI